tara:strand:+ start:4153 stop:5019 length:867 start_codon:yes stop_codon:yes gene_type:complete
MSDETMDRIEKQLEGNSLALSAVAEVLSKMDGRLSRDEDVSLAKQEEEEAAADRSSLIKEIASEVAGILKDGDAGLDVDGEKVRPAAKTGKAPSGADDSEKPTTIKTNISDQQATIQAMIKEYEAKADEDDKDDEKAEEYPVDEKKGGMKYKADDDDEEDDEDVAKAGNGEATDEDEDEDDAEKSMMKQLAALKKQVADYEASMQKSVQNETESRLRKMGFREDNGLQRPTRVEVGLGIDGTTPIQKQAAQADTIDQLTSLSYKELRDLQTNIEAGKTDGVPRELLET